MNLFIDSISNPCFLALYNASGEIQHKVTANVAMNESSKLIHVLDDFLKQTWVSYNSLENISIVCGPGSFTWVRTACLIVNTIAFNNDIFLTSLSYFDLFETYPIIKNSSKRDVFIKKEAHCKIKVLENASALEYIQEKNINIFSGDFDKFEKNTIIQTTKPDYAKIIATIEHSKISQVEPIYLKKPNIS